VILYRFIFRIAGPDAVLHHAIADLIADLSRLKTLFISKENAQVRRGSRIDNIGPLSCRFSCQAALGKVLYPPFKSWAEKKDQRIHSACCQTEFQPE